MPARGQDWAAVDKTLRRPDGVRACSRDWCSVTGDPGGLAALLVSSWGQRRDLDQVVGEHHVSAPGSGALDRGQFGAIPSVAALDVADPALRPRPPFDLVAEGPSMFELAAGCAGFALARDGDAVHPELVQVAFDLGFAVAAISGDRVRRAPGAAGDPFDRWGELWRVCGVAGLDVVVEDDAVGVVHDLGLVAELDRLAETALADRPGVGVVQADQPGRTVGHLAPQSGAGLCDDPACALQGRVQFVQRAMQPAFRLPGGPAQRPAGVADDRVRVTHGRFGEVGQLAGDAPHGGLGLVALLRATQPQLAGNRTCPLSRGPAPVPRPGADRTTSSLHPPTVRAILPTALASR